MAPDFPIRADLLHYLARRFCETKTSTVDGMAADKNHAPTHRTAQALYSRWIRSEPIRQPVKAISKNEGHDDNPEPSQSR
jgi:hypothetical protein